MTGWAAPFLKRTGAVLLAVLLAACGQIPASAAAETAVATPAATHQSAEAPGLAQAIFAGGCFWGIEGVFSHVIGVTSAVSGYHGGMGDTAQYELVSAGNTGHAESVRVTYDPARVRYDQLLRIFFAVTDPTELNRQGPDEGSQYRSALVPLNEEQRKVAADYLAQLGHSGLWHQRIVTRIEPYRHFYAAESYHQDFMARNPGQGYITYWDVPKVAAIKRLFPELYKPDFTRN